MALQEAGRRIEQLEEAISRLDFVKKHLNRNSSEIKSQIHSNVSRNLELLRQREVWLLGQVDRVLGAKEDALHDQQVRLNTALGVLQSGLALSAEGGETNTKSLTETLASLRTLQLSPEATPYIAFRADHVALRETILAYGRVDANGLPLASAFDDPGNPSASLPRHVEDYEDVDHHIFYKTVEEIKRMNNSSAGISVNIPKLSTHVEDWLQKPSSLALSATEDKKGGGCTTTTPKGFASGEVTPAETCSINSWLSHIKHSVDLEEEHDFEIIDNSVAKVSVKRLDEENSVWDLFHHISKDIQVWLRPGQAVAEAEICDFFKHITKDTKAWLIQACQQLACLDEVKLQDPFRHIPKDSATWLRKAHDRRQTREANGAVSAGVADDFFKHISCDSRLWLLKARKSSSDTLTASCCKSICSASSDASITSSTSSADESDKGNSPSPIATKKSLIADRARWLKSEMQIPVVPQVEDLCRANEICGNISECVCQPDCAKLFLEENSPVKNRAVVSPAENGRSIGEFWKPLELDASAWLMPSSGSPSLPGKDEQPSCDLFHHIPLAKEEWLKKEAGGKPSPCVWTPSPTKKMGKEEVNLWLKQKSSPQPVVDDLFAHLRGMDKEQWLMKASPALGEKAGREEGDVWKEDDVSSEGWSVCSTPGSLSDEQAEKSVEVATAYLNEWLM